jgi:hypothetical protein
MSEIPWFWPGVAVSLIVAAGAGQIVARHLRIERTIGFLLPLTLGVIAAATLTPGREALESGMAGMGGCDFRRILPAGLPELREVAETRLNIALLVPLGMILGLLPRGRARAILAVGALALPFAIEAFQMFALPLDRACESADVIDNLTGLAIGLVVGGFLGGILHRSALED